MIKLVISDMDGTLLRDDKYLNPEIFEVIHRMHRQGVVFVAASGRQYQSMRRRFAPVADQIYFVSDNGCRILYRGEELFYRPMETAVAQGILEQLRTEYPHCSAMLSSRKRAYTNSHRQEEYLSSGGFRYDIEYREDLRTVDDPEIVKISFVEPEDAIATMNEMRRRYGKEAAVTFSGFHCIDFMARDINKGTALAFLQARLGIGRDETVAFGDNFNDLEMMAEAGTSYAMSHSPVGVRTAATRVLGSNNNDAALREMARLFPGRAKR